MSESESESVSVYLDRHVHLLQQLESTAGVKPEIMADDPAEAAPPPPPPPPPVTHVGNCMKCCSIRLTLWWKCWFAISSSSASSSGDHAASFVAGEQWLFQWMRLALPDLPLTGLILSCQNSSLQFLIKSLMPTQQTLFRVLVGRCHHSVKPQNCSIHRLWCCRQC